MANTISDKLDRLFNLRLINTANRKKNSKYSALRKIFLKIHQNKSIDNKKFMVFDIGANEGKESKKFEEILKKEHINYELHVFEPNPNIINKIKEKNIKNLKIINKGVGNKIDRKILKIDISSEKSSFNDKILNNDISDEISCDFETIDLYLKKNNIKNINFLKIDTEGFNQEVLEGAKNSLEKGMIDLILTEVTLGLKYKNKTESIYNIEKYLKNNYALIGINNQYLLEFNSVFHNKAFNIDLLYINKKFMNLLV